MQGVGFRPLVYRLAKRHQLTGWIRNGTDGVHIEVNASKSELEQFVDEIKNQIPNIARIDHIDWTIIPSSQFQDFQIRSSAATSMPTSPLTPDFGLCASCRMDMETTNNTRFHYPFTTCIHCGPRFSILRSLPFDRERTSMRSFVMCKQCRVEYSDPSDRRHHSQTNSCPSCAVTLSLDPFGQSIESVDEVIDKIVAFWKDDKIVAIKGIGGFLLTADATSQAAIKTLRMRKNRPHKPFALMFATSSEAEKFVDLSQKQIQLLTGPIAPIVLAQIRKTALPLSGVAPQLDQLGVMLPYAPLFHLLMRQVDHPIIATSANFGDAPIIYDDRTGSQALGNLADLIIYHNRAIVNPQDDSVIKFAQSRRIILRRSRGLAPTLDLPKLDLSDETVFAAGAMMKSTCALQVRKQVFVSQYIGDLVAFETQKSYEKISTQLLDICKADPKFILCDVHPEYASTRFAQDLAQRCKATLISVQHHLAHFAAILGEHGLCNTAQPILGVVWDGLGWGSDRQLWGGEFFVYHGHAFKRLAHLHYFPYLAQDKMSREPRLSALSLTHHFEDSDELLRKKFTSAEWRVYQKLLRGGLPVQTSSMGRLFDAVASLLDIVDVQTYEGQAAILLERRAKKYFEHGDPSTLFNVLASTFSVSSDQTISTDNILTQVTQDLHRGVAKEEIAAKFHCILVLIIEQIASQHNYKKIAFSGGVFQNALLVDLITHKMKKMYTLFFHEQLAPNDENIAFGQIVYREISKLSSESEHSNDLHQVSHG